MNIFLHPIKVDLSQGMKRRQKLEKPERQEGPCQGLVFLFLFLWGFFCVNLRFYCYLLKKPLNDRKRLRHVTLQKLLSRAYMYDVCKITIKNSLHFKKEKSRLTRNRISIFQTLYMTLQKLHTLVNVFYPNKD